MAFMNKLVASGLATLAVLATTAAASAAPAYATNNVNVRSGPGTGYAAIDTLRRGERVDVQQCRGSWCYVVKPGPDGWVSSSYLASGGGRPGWDNGGWDNGGWNPPPRPPRPAPPPPPYWDNYPPPPPPPYWNNPRPQPIYPVYPSRPSSSVCVNSPNSYFCIGD